MANRQKKNKLGIFYVISSQSLRCQKLKFIFISTLLGNQLFCDTIQKLFLSFVCIYEFFYLRRGIMGIKHCTRSTLHWPIFAFLWTLYIHGQLKYFHFFIFCSDIILYLLDYESFQNNDSLKLMFAALLIFIIGHQSLDYFHSQGVLKSCWLKHELVEKVGCLTI